MQSSSMIAVIASEMLEPPSNYKETTYITLVFNSDGNVEGIRYNRDRSSTRSKEF
ncbi:MAG: hypothetical protein NZ517_02240 [Candidatus Nitrosocaldus sp.]|nr:hypothetical protein [Candidatus Nitrosocaldus sp.]